MIDKTSTALIVALISILGLTSCIRYNVAEPLDRFSSPEMGTADGNEITVTAGSTWFAEGEYLYLPGKLSPGKMRKRPCCSIIPTGNQAMR